MPALLELPAYFDLTDRGDVEYQFRSRALGQAIDNWLRATPTTALYGAGNAGILWRMVHKPLTPQYAQIMQAALENAFQNEFNPPLQIRSLTVEADRPNRIWRIYGELYSPYYGVGAEINYSLEG